MSIRSGLLFRTLIFIHRWVGVALCALFLLWFPSGIGIMYWDYPDVTGQDRLEHSPPLDSAKVLLSPEAAWGGLFQGPILTPDLLGPVVLNSFDGRPVYRFADGTMVFADTGQEHTEISSEMMLRIASAWSGQPAETVKVESADEIDQWTVGGAFRYRPLWKYSWPDGQQVYLTESTGDVVQYTTTASRLGAYVGAIPHWFYFTPLRKNGALWSRVVIWTSGIGALTALLGVAIGLWMYSPSKTYRNAGAPTSIPYRGQKRWHMVFGLVFGLATITWAFSGMLSLEPFPTARGGPSERDAIPQALGGEVDIAAFATKNFQQALAELSPRRVKQLETGSFAGEPFYLATLEGGDTSIVPVNSAVRESFEPKWIIDIATRAVGENGLADIRVIDQYDAYYLDRRRQRPLPVVLARLNDADATRYYIDPKTGRVVEAYSSKGWVNRWVYHGLHSLNFPWLYNYRPLWDIVVITFMLGGTALGVTSLILAWRVIGRTLRRAIPGAAESPSELTEDLVVETD
jgi:hypothetical protein